MRVKNVVPRKKRKKKILKEAKGYYGARSKCYRIAKQAVMKAWAQAYVGRKEKKRNFRRLWITRLNAAVREEGLNYSKFIHGLKKIGIKLDRKTLTNLATSKPEVFKEICKQIKAAA